MALPWSGFKVASLSLFALLIGVLPTSAADLTVKVVNLRSQDGVVRFALYNNPDTFLETDGKLRKDHVPVVGDTATLVYRGLTPGQYGVAAFHDENNNDEFDQGIFGIPLEGYGFSRDAPVFMSEPDFKDAVVDVLDAAKTITIKMRY